ncbi:TraE/TraK family type IV conjugative transfer system protein [Acinetobacter baumannii]
MLNETESRIVKQGITSVWSSSGAFTYQESEKTVTVEGMLKTYLADRLVSEEPKKLNIKFSMNKGTIALYSMGEVRENNGTNKLAVFTASLIISASAYCTQHITKADKQSVSVAVSNKDLNVLYVDGRKMVTATPSNSNALNIKKTKIKVRSISKLTLHFKTQRYQFSSLMIMELDTKSSFNLKICLVKMLCLYHQQKAKRV